MEKELNPLQVWNKERKEFPYDQKQNVVEIPQPWTKKQAYATSQSVGLRFQSPSSHYIDLKPLQICNDGTTSDDRIQKVHYVSTSQKAFTWKYSKDIDPLNKANRMAGRKSKFIKEYSEKANHQKIVVRLPISEYKDNYNFHECVPHHQSRDLKEKILCKVQGIARDDQPRIKPEDGGVLQILDIYNTTSRSQHHYISPEEAKKYKNVKVDVSPLIPSRKAMFDESIFKARHLDRTIPKQLKRVPHSGVESESMGAYKQPLDELSHKPLRGESSTFEQKQSKGDVFAIPGMYQTEYSHMGTGWSLRNLL